MEVWQVLLMVVLIGLAVGFVVHSLLRFAQGSSLLATLLAGVAGALIAVYYLQPEVGAIGRTMLESRIYWALIGSIVLSFIVEMLFAGTRRGRVVAS
jgi:uncharacterized membrane protein YeaQ/YmgE (transglycosylase-associated protein family)